MRKSGRLETAAAPIQHAFRSNGWKKIHWLHPVNILEEPNQYFQSNSAAAVDRFFFSARASRETKPFAILSSVTLIRPASIAAFGVSFKGNLIAPRGQPKPSPNFHCRLTAFVGPDFWAAFAILTKASRFVPKQHGRFGKHTSDMQSETAADYLKSAPADARRNYSICRYHRLPGSLRLTQVPARPGIASRPDVAQRRFSLTPHWRQANGFGIFNERSFEHAIAVLVGKTPAEFSIPPCPLK